MSETFRNIPTGTKSKVERPQVVQSPQAQARARAREAPKANPKDTNKPAEKPYDETAWMGRLDAPGKKEAYDTHMRIRLLEAKLREMMQYKQHLEEKMALAKLERGDAQNSKDQEQSYLLANTPMVQYEFRRLMPTSQDPRIQLLSSQIE